MNRWRRPAWWSVALVVAGVAFFTALGVWQLDRAAEKDELLRRYAAAEHSAAQPFESIADAPPSDAYPRVAVQGRFVDTRTYVLDDQTHAGQVGVRVYVPFAPDGLAHWVLVDLGFLPHEQGHHPSLPPLPQGHVSLQGLYTPPPGVGMRMGGDPFPAQSGAMKSMVYVDIGQVSHDLHHGLYPWVLRLQSDPASVYLRDWVPAVMPPARHRAYAFQWFTFAFAAVVIFVLLHRQRRSRPL
jgi:cytochrome oxidase assembly protein ShyY1